MVSLRLTLVSVSQQTLILPPFPTSSCRMYFCHSDLQDLGLKSLYCPVSYFILRAVKDIDLCQRLATYVLFILHGKSINSWLPKL